MSLSLLVGTTVAILPQAFNSKIVCNLKLFFIFLNQTFVVGTQKNRKIIGKKIFIIVCCKELFI